MVIIVPFGKQFAAIGDNGRLAPGQTLSCGRHQRGGSARATGLGQTRAAFPDTQADICFVYDLGKADIGTLGEKRIMLDPMADGARRNGLSILDNKDAMRIAHRHRAGIFQKSLSGIDRDRQGFRVQFPAERNIAPIGARQTQINANTHLTCCGRGQATPCRVQRQRSRACFTHDQPCDAARTIAAGPRLAAIGIQHAHERVARVAVFDDQELVESVGLRELARLILAKSAKIGMCPDIQHQKGVSCPVHQKSVHTPPVTPQAPCVQSPAR